MAGFFIVGLALIPLVILLNVILFYVLIKIAIKRFVKPELERKQLLFVDYKWVGFWGCGDYKNESIEFALFKTGLNTISIYSYIYYKDSDCPKRTTIKIYITGFNIDRVEYRNVL